MKSLLARCVCVVALLTLCLPVATAGLPYYSAKLSETLTLLPSFSGGVSATFMVYHGDWYAMSSASLSIGDSLSVTHMLDVGVGLGDYVSVSCNAFQMPSIGLCTLSASGSLAWLSLTLIEADPTVKLDSTLDAQLPLVGGGGPSVSASGSLTATVGRHRGSLYATLTPAPFQVSAGVSASLHLFETETRIGDRDTTFSGTLRLGGALTPLDFTSGTATLLARSGVLSGSVSATFRPGQPLSLSLGLSHPLELF